MLFWNALAKAVTHDLWPLKVSEHFPERRPTGSCHGIGYLQRRTKIPTFNPPDGGAVEPRAISHILLSHPHIPAATSDLLAEQNGETPALQRTSGTTNIRA